MSRRYPDGAWRDGEVRVCTRFCAPTSNKRVPRVVLLQLRGRHEHDRSGVIRRGAEEEGEEEDEEVVITKVSSRARVIVWSEDSDEEGGEEL